MHQTASPASLRSRPQSRPVNGPPRNDVPPLPLTAFERYMWADDTPEYPMSGQFEIRYTGVLDREAFEKALRATFEQHPLQRALLDVSRPRRPTWRIQPEFTIPLDWACADKPRTYAEGEQIDLTREIGTRIWVRQGDEHGSILFQFHHVTTDGIGVCNFVSDVLLAYDALIANGTNGSQLPQRNPKRLLSRGDIYPPDRAWRARLETWLRILEGLKRWRTFYPRPFRGTGSKDVAPAPMGCTLVETLTAEQTTSLRESAKRQGATLNDRLVRDLFLSLVADCGTEQPDGNCLRVTIPVNLRLPSDSDMPAANKLTMCNLNRSDEQCREPDKLLDDICRETRDIRGGRGRRLIAILNLLTRLYGRIPQRFMGNKCLSTVVFSNLGNVDKLLPRFRRRDDGRIVAGNVTVDALATVPDVRPQTSLVFVAMTYAGRLSLVLRYDPRLLSAAEARQFLADYSARLRD